MVLIAVLGGCTGPDPAAVGGQGPPFDPLAFFTGHVTSWGVMENRAGAPTGVVTTDCEGTVDAAGTLQMQQHLTLPDGRASERRWTLRRTGADTWQATANDMVGTADGTSHGRVFHWTWILASRPGDPLFNLQMSQWMYAMADGSVVNRTQISKLGIILAEVTEQFRRAP